MAALSSPPQVHWWPRGQPLVSALRASAQVDWRQAVAYGLLWGVVVAALESISATVYMPPGIDTLHYVGSLLLLWTSRGVVIAWTAQASEAWLTSRAVAALFAFELVLLSLSWDGLTSLSLTSERLYGLGLPLRANFLYNFWILLVYGGLFFWFCMLGRRTRHTRDVLARAEIERSRTDGLLVAAQLESLKGRVDPALLLRAMSALRDRYARSRKQGEALLDATVAFLRHAMPGVRTGRSSVESELALVRAYAQLMELLAPGRMLCHVSAAPLPRDLPIPSMLLLPLIERLHAAQAVAVPVVVELTADARCMKLCLAGQAVDEGWLTDELAARLQHALSGLFGHEGRWTAGGRPSLTLWLPLPAGQNDEAHDA